MSAAQWAVLIVLVLPAGFLAAAIGLGLLWIGERVHRWWRGTDRARIEADAAEREAYRAAVAALTVEDVAELVAAGWPDAGLRPTPPTITLSGGPADGQVVDWHPGLRGGVCRVPDLGALPRGVADYATRTLDLQIALYRRDGRGVWRYAGTDAW